MQNSVQKLELTKCEENSVQIYLGLCTKDVHPKGGGGGLKIVDENGQGGRGGSGRMDVHFLGPSN